MNANGDCVDELPEEICDGFLEAGWCGTGRFVGTQHEPRGPEDDIKNIRASCSNTCGLCKDPNALLDIKFPGGECLDKAPECSDWAAIGECDANDGFMKGDLIAGEFTAGHCMLSCHVCFLLTRGPRIST
eukprot:CAMPEP_0114238952 /NCGR_PEP_ID=MMETSP0058-20121206/8193_1 /TAXON_ID=36894 /ORGANISM="Pyramimonas parkeae, CCMP726" /LENGTH=129 /DNA_ID=CAMNT_0001351085 /DNA_START=690 /DNA_END=1079 /DNA_ORIENTATION=-